MALVYGSAGHTGINVGEQQSSWDVAATTFYSIALVSDSFHTERDTFNDVEEFGSYGGRESIETGRAFSVGEFTVIPRYDSVAFHLLMAHAMGTETLGTANTTVGRGSGATENNGTPHIYTFGTSLPLGLTIQVYKSGDAAGGLREEYVGCIITGFTFEQPEGDVARVTFRFLGKKATLTQLGTIVPDGAGSRAFTARDLVYDAAARKTVEIKTGIPGTYDWPSGTPGDDLPIRSFTLDVDRKIELSQNFITSPDTVEKPGITGTREVTISLESYLERTATSSTRYPYYQFQNNTNSTVNIIYNDTSLLTASTGYPREFRIDLPALTWESGEAPLSDAGVINLSLSARAYMYNTFSGHSGVPANDTELRVLAFVGDSDKVATVGGDAKFSSL